MGRKKKPKPTVHSLTVVPMPGTNITEKQIVITQKLIEYAESQGVKLETIVFPIGG